MANKDTVSMFGPSFDGSGVIVNREVPPGDVQAYQNAGYEVGSVPEIVYTEADAIAQNDGEDVTATATPVKRARRK